MDQWRAFFARAGADIWTVIEQAIVVAATDYPNEFKDKRSDIAETLFSRRSLQLRSVDRDATRLSGSVVTCATNLKEENEVRDDEEKTDDTRAVFSVEANRHHCSYDEAVALTDVLEEETLLIKEIYRIKESLADEPGQSVKILIDSLQRLEYMDITVEALKFTKIGKQVNSLRKHSSKRVRTLVKLLVRGWKDLVDEWVNTAGDVAAAAIAGSGGSGKTEAENEEQGLPFPPLDEGAWLAASTTSLEISQFLNFMDDLPTGCADGNSKEDDCIQSLNPDCLHIFSKSQSRIMQLDHGKCDTEVNMHHSDRGMRVPEERRSTNRVDYDLPDRLENILELDYRNSTSQNMSNQKDLDQHSRLLTNKIGVGSSSPRRSTNDLSKTRIGAAAASFGPGRPSKVHANQRPSETFINQPDKTCKPSSSNQKSTFADDQVALRLELAKRKLHEGYQQAENARKQRTVQLVELPDLPKGGPNQVKVNGSGQSRPGPQNGYWYQNRKAVL